MAVKALIAASALFCGLASAVSHTVTVGPGVQFNPDTLTAAEGDTIDFEFASTSHDVIQGNFDSPCEFSDAGFYSGFPSNVGDTFSVTVNNTDPMWIYCSFQGHCQGGMVMVVNEPSSGNETLAAYRTAAGKVSTATDPDEVRGGVYVSNGTQASATESSASGSSTATATQSAASTGAAVVIAPNAIGVLAVAGGLFSLFA